MCAEHAFNSPCQKLNMTVHSGGMTLSHMCVQSDLHVGFKPSREHAC